jgi:prepilin-type N-terminal cleavage/methylation domain-containing protein
MNIRRQSNRGTGVASLRAGFTLVEIMIVVAIIGLLASIAIPNFVKARTQAQTTACVNNLRQIQGAIETWALEMKKGPNDPVTDADLFGPALYIKQKPECPAGGTYTITTVSAPPTCSVGGTHVLP